MRPDFWRSFWRRPEKCRYCDDMGTVQVRVGKVKIWVCRHDTDSALDDVIKHWNEVKK